MASTSPLRIAMTSYYLPSGSKIGVGYQVHALANALHDRGHEVTVFSGCPSSEGSRYRTVTLPLGRRLRTFRFAMEVRKLDLSAFDVLHAHGDDYWLWRDRGVVHVRTLHGSCFAEALRIKGSKEKLRMLLLGLGESLGTLIADHAVTVSPGTRTWAPWIRTVIPNGVNGALLTGPSTPSDNPTILFVGTYHQRKRGKLLMEVFRDRVLPEVPGAELWMVSTDAPPAPHVRQWGRLSDIDLADLYRRAWVFCLPSTYEGFGIPYAEAMTAGLPVVATDNPGARYVLDDGRAGLIVEDDWLGSTIAELLQDAALRTTWGVRARARAATFSMDAVIDQYERLYRSK